MTINSDIPSHLLKGVRFSLYDAQQIKQLSVKEITNSAAFDALLRPADGGPYDAALGSSESDDVCTTCGQSNLHCPGHMGHITLPLPCYNPVTFQLMTKVCHAFFSCSS